MSIRIAIFDDNKNIRNSICLLLHSVLSMDVVGNFSDATECVDHVIKCQPDVILMDLQMPVVNGIDAIRMIKSKLPDVKILVQTMHEDDEHIMEAIVAGASGYILKNQLNLKLIDAIRELQSDGSHLSAPVARKVINIIQQGSYNKLAPTDSYNLTVREKEVLGCIVSGLSHKMVGYELSISYETVRSHVKKIYEKLEVSSLTEVVAKAINQNLV